MKETISKIKAEVIKRLPSVFAYAAVVSPVIIRMIRNGFYRGNCNYFLYAIPLLFLNEKFVQKHPQIFFCISWIYFIIMKEWKPF